MDIDVPTHFSKEPYIISDLITKKLRVLADTELDSSQWDLTLRLLDCFEHNAPVHLSAVLRFVVFNWVILAISHSR